MSPLTHFTAYAAILRLPLSLTERLLLCLILTFDSKGLKVNNSEIGKAINVSVFTVANALSSLRKRGLIQTEKAGSKYRKIRLNVEALLHLLRSEVEESYLTDLVNLLHSSSSKLPHSLGSEHKERSKRRDITAHRKKPKPRKVHKFTPPTAAEVKAYAASRGYPDFDAERFVEYYAVNDWHDSKGNRVCNWKQKLLAVWLKDGDRKLSCRDATDEEAEELFAEINP